MKLLLYCWSSNNEGILYENLIKMGYDVIKVQEKCEHYTRDMKLASKLLPIIHQHKVDAIVSFNFLPIISMICQTACIEYYSWVYDCPHHTLYSLQTPASCNHIGVFDKMMMNDINRTNSTSLFHLPLAVDCNFFKNAINSTTNSTHAYSCDISFVGSLYDDAHNYFNTLDIDISIRNETMSQLDNLLFDYNKSSYDLLWNSSIINYWSEKLTNAGLTLDEDYISSPSEVFHESVVARKVTNLERTILLSQLTNLYTSDKLHIYTNSKLHDAPALIPYNRGTVSYKSQMPLVFNNSRINLNITLRSIRSGVPLRILDIMACGGFVLSNYQPEIEELFDINKEIVVFHSLEDCISKIEYYLQHEDERRAIATAGHKAVVERFTYDIQLKKLFSTSPRNLSQ